MECRSCFGLLGASDEVMFFIKGERSVHLILKPERERVVFDRAMYIVHESRKKVTVKCKGCNSNVGRQLPFAPGGSTFLAFGVDKVRLANRCLPGKRKWWEAFREFPCIETRDEGNYFGSAVQLKHSMEERNKETYVPLNFPSLSDIHVFEWYSVCLKKRPRAEQIRGYVSALQRDTIVVMSTGAGKTLIASMFLAKICSLNPNYMGLMIVDRIPLVFQQGHAISRDADLRVACICGENRTNYKLRQIHDGCFDVLVVTAGAFSEMIKRKELNARQFCAVVVDECHHAVSAHVYTDVLRLFQQMPLAVRPRLLGLTASPFEAKSLEQASNKLDKFLSTFMNAQIFCPALPNGHQRYEKICVDLSTLQQTWIGKALGIVRALLRDISERIAGMDLSIKDDLSDLHMLQGELRPIEDEYGHDVEMRKACQTALVGLQAILACSSLGTIFANRLIVESKFASFFNALTAFTDECGLRLKALHDILLSQSRPSKVIVFVKTRILARYMHGFLAESFPDFSPAMFVGHGGFDGMDWENEQAEALKNFRRLENSLLVSTSVLEEGLDVAHCDLVILYSGVQSLTQFIQSRGRARKSNSRFIVMHGSEQIDFVNSVEHREAVLQHALRERRSVQSLDEYTTDKIISTITRDYARASPKKTCSDSKFDGAAPDLALKVYVPCMASDAKKVLVSHFESLDSFKLKRIEAVVGGARVCSGTSLVFGESDSAFLVGLSPKFTTTPLTYREFIKTFDFKLVSGDEAVSVWTQSADTSVSSANDLRFELLGIEVGHFTDRAAFSSMRRVTSVSDMHLSFTGRSLEVTMTELTDEEEVSTVVDIPLPSLTRFALLSSQRPNLALFFPVMFPPTVSRNAVRLLGFHNSVLQSFAEHPVFMFSFKYDDADVLLKCLSSSKLFPIPVFDTRVNIALDDPEQQDLGFLSMNSYWIWSAILCSRHVCFPPAVRSGLTAFLRACVESKARDDPGADDIIEFALLQLHGRISRSAYFADILEHFRLIWEDLVGIKSSDVIPWRARVPNNHHLIQRLVITPSRVCFLPALPTASNRLLRRFASKKSDIVIVAFKEEHYGKLRGTDVLSHVEDVLRNGILVNLVPYKFLFASASQLREHKAYFVAESASICASDIRKWILPNTHEFTSVAKYLSRLGLYGTADVPITTPGITWHSELEDVRSADGALVTDGAGKISTSLAQVLARDLELAEVPAAFQFRMSGTKGILVIASDDDHDLRSKDVAIRPSMVKFTNNDLGFSLVDVSKPLDVCLNREVITLLTCLSSGSDELGWGGRMELTLQEYLENELERAAEMFLDDQYAHGELRNYFPPLQLQRMKSSGFKVLEESFWFRVLQGAYRLRVRELRTRTSIRVKNGRLLMGVPDPLGVLNEDQIFCQLQEEENGNRLVLGPVLLYRNPCLHPGDLRRVSAVDQPSLRHLRNVVVLPTKGISYSLSSACSGGDLDGDKYAVIWDSNLVPPPSYVKEPCNYAELAGDSAHCDDDITSITVIADFYKRFVANDALGRVAHIHLALCDALPAGALEPLAIELAKSQSKAVDFPKTGIPPMVPSEALSIVRARRYPDFMEKPVQRSYTSEKLLGFLYRRAVSVVCDFESVPRGKPMLLFDMNLFVQGHERYMESAAQAYCNYAYCMDALLTRFQLRSEADIVLGQATYHWSELLKSDRGKASETIRNCYKEIVNRFRAEFFSDVVLDSDVKEKASAWYRIVNDNSIKVKRVLKKKFLSFPWVVWDVLCDIKAEKASAMPSRVLLSVGNSATVAFQTNAPQLLVDHASKMKVAKLVRHAINALVRLETDAVDPFLISVYGSTSIYLNEPDSDVDVCVLARDAAMTTSLVHDPVEFSRLSQSDQDRHFLKNFISRAISNVALSKEERLSARVPIIKCRIGDHENPEECDVSMNKDGLLKTVYIHKLYERCPEYLIVFWTLVRWARSVGIIRSNVEATATQMDTGDFYALMITILKCPCDWKIEPSVLSRSTGLRYLLQKLNSIDQQKLALVGDLVISFFRNTMGLKEGIKLAWPVADVPVVYIDEGTMKFIATASFSAFHFLCATRDVNALFQYAVQCSSSKAVVFSQKLNRSLSFAMSNSRAFHAAHLTTITGAKVTLQPMPGHNELLLSAEGSPASIDRLRSELRELIRTSKAVVLGRVSQNSSRYFMAGSSLVFALGCTSSDNLVRFSESLGPFELAHRADARSCAYVATSRFEERWQSQVVEQAAIQLFQQLTGFPSENKELRDSMEVTARYGCFYMVKLSDRFPEGMNSLPLKEFQLSLEKGRRTRKLHGRTDFQDQRTSQGDHHTSHENVSETDSKFHMEFLPASGKADFATKIKNDVKKKQNTTRGLTSAFTPGLYQSNSVTHSARQHALTAYVEALKACGFRLGNSRNRKPSVWKVSISPSACYEAELELDTSLEVVGFQERNLHWLHCTLLNHETEKFANGLLLNPNLRINVTTSDKIKPGCDLYNFVLSCEKGKMLIPIKIVDGKPVYREQIDEKVRKSITLVRHVEQFWMYTNGSVDASVVYGTCYLGRNFELERSLCELTLYFDGARLDAAMRVHLDSLQVQHFCKHVLTTSFQIKQALEQELTKIVSTNP